MDDSEWKTAKSIIALYLPVVVCSIGIAEKVKSPNRQNAGIVDNGAKMTIIQGHICNILTVYI